MMRLAFATAVGEPIRPALVARAAELGAALLMLPEATNDLPSEPSDGESARGLAALARRHRVAILRGYVERCTTGVYNASMLVDATGTCIANYRQTHGCAADREQGQWLTAMPIDGLRMGILIGHDLEFPEPSRALTLAGCELVVFSGGVSDSDGDLLLPARARENRCWIAYSGASAGLWGPDGARRHLERAEAHLWLGEIDRGGGVEPVRTRMLAARRPRLYHELTYRPVEDEVRPS